MSATNPIFQMDQNHLEEKCKEFTKERDDLRHKVAELQEERDQLKKAVLALTWEDPQVSEEEILASVDRDPPLRQFLADLKCMTESKAPWSCTT